MRAANIYIYCLIRSDQPITFVAQAMGAQSDRVNTIGYRALAAVISASAVAAYEPTPANLLAHQLVLEAVMADYTVLPVRFGTVAPSVEVVVEQLLKPRYAELDGLLRDMDQKVEVVLKLTWREAEIFSEIVDSHPEVRRLRDLVASCPPDQARAERVQLGRMVETALWSRRDEDAQAALARLRPLAQRVQVNGLSNDMMVLNAAFLIERTHEAEFDATVEALQREQNGRLIFDYFGPLPPYDFANIVFHLDGQGER